MMKIFAVINPWELLFIIIIKNVFADIYPFKVLLLISMIKPKLYFPGIDYWVSLKQRNRRMM